MSTSFLFQLINNAALLLALGLLYGFAINLRRESPAGRLALGLALGVIGIAVMLNPVVLVPGIVYDTRSILISIAGLFFGALPTAVAMAMTAALRLAQGGLGAWTGAGVILASGLTGLAWRHLRGRSLERMGLLELYLFGALVHVVMLLCMLTLPGNMALKVISGIYLPVLLIYPAATALLGKTLLLQLARKVMARQLREHEARYRSLFENNHAVMLLVDPHGGSIVDANPAAESYYGWPREQLTRKNISEINVLPREEIEAAMRRAAERGQNRFSFRHRRADGSERDVQVYSGRIQVEARPLLYSIVFDVTEQREAELAQRKSEELQRAIVTISPAALYGVDLRGMVTVWNPAAERIFGWSAEEVMGAPLPIVPEEHADQFQELRNRTLGGERFTNLEVRRRRKDGTLFDCSLSTAALLNDAGETVGIMAVIEDITERKQAERALKHSEENYRITLQSIGDAVIATDTHGDVRHLNAVAAELTGWPEAEALGRPLAEIFPIINEDTRLPVESPLVKVLAEGVVVGLANHTLLVSRDGREVPIADSGAPIFDDRGRIEGVVLVFRDQTAERADKRRIRESERKYRQLYGSIRDAIVVADMDRTIIDCNPSCLELFGYAKSEIVGNKSLLLYADEREFEQVGRTLGGQMLGTGFFYSAWFRKKNGETFPGETSVYFRRDDEGRVTGFVGLIRDVTDRKQAEESLLATNRELEEAITRAEALAEEAQAANRAKSEFLANMSHELRTPLNGAMGMLQLLQAQSLNAEAAECVEMALTSSEHLLHLLEDILDLSRVEAGRMEIAAREFELAEALRFVTGLYGHQARDRGIRLATDIAEDLPEELVGDPIRLRQILVNLVGNAVKFTERGEVELSVRRRGPARAAEDGDGKTVELLFGVRDTGVGIPRDMLERVFEPFTQVDGTLTRSYGGTGLGLAVVARLVDLMDGEITLESEVGVGTRALVRLPFRLPAEPGGRERRAADAPPAAATAPLRILVAEDDEVNSLFLQRSLQKLGHTATVVRNGKGVLELLARQDFDCILMDIQMPTMDGMEATAAIRRSTELGEKARIPIVALTAHAMSGDREKFLEAGMNDYISKPISIRGLREVLARALAR
ncbi:MAG: PAS domain S-box protein [Desulfovibrionaceae bacterium]|jgi:PAS domain S-box-containing protein|nr:PAS domain S-box protein [Desulfovibrionaceae bacterium]